MRLQVLVLLSLLAAAWAVGEGETAASAVAVDAQAADAAAVGAGALESAQTQTEGEAEAESEADAETEADSELQAGVAAEAAAEAESGAEMEARKTKPINCMDAKVRRFRNRAGTRGSGVYFVQPLDGQPGFDIWCDMRTNGGGWNVFSKRQDGSVDFYRPWVDYKSGFGSAAGEYWLGMDKINRLSKTMPHKLRIDLTAFDGTKRFGTWRTFMVDDEEHKYTLTARGFRDGGIGNSLSYHSGRPFSTYDRDNDAWANNCASYFHGAWWYGACHHSNLNGKYYQYPGKHPNNYADGADWLTFRGHFESAKKVQMKFK
jgi:ficolin